MKRIVIDTLLMMLIGAAIYFAFFLGSGFGGEVERKGCCECCKCCSAKPAPGPVVVPVPVPVPAPVVVPVPVPVPKPTPRPSPAPSPADPLIACDEPTGFGVCLNTTRAKHGLQPVVLDVNLSLWASENNKLMTPRRFSGHFAPNHGWWSCALFGRVSAAECLSSFMGSWAHRAAVLRPDVTTYGVHFDGLSWTLNLR